MQISKTNTNTMNFKSNIPIYKVVSRSQEGVQEITDSNTIKGLSMALVKRLNTPNSKENVFFKKLIPDFWRDQIATSSYIGKSIIAERNIILGNDANIANELRQACYQKGDMTEAQINDYIHNSLIEPLMKKVRLFKNENDKTGELVGLKLYADKKGSKYVLNGIDITSIDGRKFAILEPEIKIKKTKNKQVQTSTNK